MNKPPSKRKKVTSRTPKNPDVLSQDHQDLVTIEVTAVEVEELTQEEQRDLLHLERKVERAVFEAGKALMELRDCLRHWRSQSQTLPFNAFNL
ncbi:hypothetical protein PN465_11450 [Nodularia spumigena CS-584]|uniref:Uncharacterized protein n=1 Tax=Nodularia spumigena UHCC 0060 TaxID=3110300 RepID=A0ABU5UX93_NODSP|nr:hypothetical protein [Nodularia spumigena]AHJ28590.1 hypothetical protein NSP_22580 [Nodularia spumigena CCY9414]EAW43337.1 hypothetical protein N9414_06394 [Nodularia spumigena CCY9414]MDB9382831.1 hypothetical protein [Nodularia spumigena CS-584]MEA5527528.1 hypothetical protein [Nodularia spumigena UHCC 0143]MEA5610922.1 hypothetical protein [Nodularia spumigena UHCC 0060]